MTTSEFIKAKKSSFKPEFKNLVGLKESSRTSELMDFMCKLHPNQSRKAQGSKGEVFSRKGRFVEHYVFTIYTTGILRTIVSTGERRFYPYKEV